MIQKEAARDSLAVVWCDLDVLWIPAEGRVRCVLSVPRCAVRRAAPPLRRARAAARALRLRFASR
jgi:hypothetical protein